MSESTDRVPAADACERESDAASYVHGALSDAERAEFESHLSSCARCAASVGAFREVVARLKALPAAQGDIAGRVAAAMARGRRRARILRMSACVTAAAAAAVLVALGSRFVVAPDESPSPDALAAASQADAAERSDPALARAVEWLSGAQEDDGSWRADRWGGNANFTVGLSGLATLAMLSGEASGGSDRAQGIRRGIAFVLSQQNAAGRFGPDFGGALYNHGIATVAVLEAHAADPKLVPMQPIVDAVAYILLCQNESGGWGYIGAEAGAANAPIAVWQMHALSLARRLGIPRTAEASDRCAAWLRTLVDETGRAGYTARLDFPYGSEALTAMAAFYLMSSPAGDLESTLAGQMGDLVTSAVEGSGRFDFYRCYYLSYALRAAHGRTEGHAAETLRERVADRQLRSGPHSGSWEPNDRWSVTGGRVYATALAMLTLEADVRAPRVIAMLKGAR
jgi:hypothetical protein